MLLPIKKIVTILGSTSKKVIAMCESGELNAVQVEVFGKLQWMVCDDIVLDYAKKNIKKT